MRRYLKERTFYSNIQELRTGPSGPQFAKQCRTASKPEAKHCNENKRHSGTEGESVGRGVYRNSHWNNNSNPLIIYVAH